MNLLNTFKTTTTKISFLADDDNDDVILKCNKIQKKIKKLVSVELDSQPVYDEKYIKIRVKTFEDKVITKFTDNQIPNKNAHCSCAAAIRVDSLIKLENKNYPQLNLEKCKFRLQKQKNIDLFDHELEDSSNKSELEAE